MGEGENKRMEMENGREVEERRVLLTAPGRLPELRVVGGSRETDLLV